MFPGRRKVYIVFFFFLGSHERSAAEQFLLLSQGVFTIKIPVLVLCQHFFLQVLGRNPLQSRLFFALVSVEKKEKIIKKIITQGRGKPSPTPTSTLSPNSNLSSSNQSQTLNSFSVYQKALMATARWTAADKPTPRCHRSTEGS